MKLIRPTVQLAVLAIPLCLSAHAIEAPADDAPPPAAAAEAPTQQKPASHPRAAFLGVVTDELPEMLAEHLGLGNQAGIIVRSVVPDGPAAKAGLATHDVITRVQDQPVASPADLTREITARKPGDPVKLDVVQKGKPARLDVILGERPDQTAALPQEQPLGDLNLDAVPKDLADRIRGMIEGNIGQMELPPDRGELGAPPAMEDAIRQMRERMEKALGGFELPQAGIQGHFDVQSGATFRMMDDQGSVEVKSNDGAKEVTVRDKDNQVVWTGPWDTEQDKAAAPDEVRQRIERLNIETDIKGNGLQLRMRPVPPPGDGKPD